MTASRFGKMPTTSLRSITRYGRTAGRRPPIIAAFLAEAAVRMAGPDAPIRDWHATHSMHPKRNSDSPKVAIRNSRKIAQPRAFLGPCVARTPKIHARC